MSVDPTFPVIIIQMDHAARVVRAAQEHPKIPRSSAQQVAPQELQHARSQVQKTDERGKTELVDMWERNRRLFITHQPETFPDT